MSNFAPTAFQEQAMQVDPCYNLLLTGQPASGKTTACIILASRSIKMLKQNVWWVCTSGSAIRDAMDAFADLVGKHSTDWHVSMSSHHQRGFFEGSSGLKVEFININKNPGFAQGYAARHLIVDRDAAHSVDLSWGKHIRAIVDGGYNIAPAVGGNWFQVDSSGGHPLLIHGKVLSAGVCDIKSRSKECPCGIDRRDCEYHK